MEKCIEETKKLIDTQVNNGKISVTGHAFSGYQKVYFSTNENINAYLKLVNFSKKNNALSVLASGDHTFNLITKGILEIDTFDTNKLTEYYVLGLKRALIIKHDYKTYNDILSLLTNPETSNEVISSIIYDLLPLMDYKYRIFWNEIVDYNNKLQKNNDIKLNLIELLFINIEDVMTYNNYLMCEENYNKLKDNLKNSNITFNNVNAADLSKTYNDKYDFILLSNILDYFYKEYGSKWDITKLNEYVYKLDKLLKKDGVIFLNYLYFYYSENNTRTFSLIKQSNINKNDLDENNYLVEKIETAGHKYGDGMILQKKK